MAHFRCLPEITQSAILNGYHDAPLRIHVYIGSSTKCKVGNSTERTRMLTNQLHKLSHAIVFTFSKCTLIP